MLSDIQALDMRTSVLTADRSATPAPAESSREMTALLSHVAKTGDRTAFSRIFLFYAPRVKTYLLRLGADAGRADDLVQEVLLKVWRKSALFNPEKAAASTWIFAIARNVRIDAIRRERRLEFDPTDPLLRPAEELDGNETTQRAERDALVQAAFARLPDAQREVVMLYFFEDEPHSVIASRLGLPLGTVKSRLRLAFDKVRKTLEALR